MMRKIAVIVLLVVSGCATPSPSLVPVRAEARFSGEYFEPSQVDVQVQPVQRRAPIYPAGLKQQGVEGYAVVEVIVDVNGIPTQAQCTEASDVAFRDATIESLLHWRFVAARKAGVPVACKITQRMEYNLGP